MDFVHASLLSPGSILVAVVTVVFLLIRAWPLPPKKDKLATLATSDHVPSRHVSVSKEPDVPEGWYRSQEVFELERRALFSKSWVYLAHTAQFIKPGAYQSFDLAGFPVFLIRGKDNKIRAFHNVCRHRAYTITRKETGASTVLGCRYHGWSYDTLGQLVKAPQFEDIPGFEKSENSLFEIHTHTTEQGWVFVNLDAGEPAPRNESTFGALNDFARGAKLRMKSEWIAGQTLTGTFNWKLGASARQFDVVAARLEQKISEAMKPSIATRIVRAFIQNNNKADCSVFPGTFLYSFEKADLWLSLTFLPSSETSTRVRYDLFAPASKAGMDENSLANAAGEVIQNAINAIEAQYQSTIEEPVENSTTTHEILKQLQEHQKLERVSGGLVRPAMRQPKGSALFQQAEQLCKELDCSGPGSQAGSGSSSSRLDW
ncbi:Aromatic-ring-hydroxylating dioxygenase alpha subunit [Penicillium verhagenii]|uniref:Aromatic-ring-hydroxylating dioxygenase alpha subunit n=1 Tax=Penicillium verhagenii TaxID=1562060 RepID=UPI0025454913|nr:Aromatic-ring-hydroxylating dioxygenase alpha subunit [Penicillium verhagenii]KAJ5919046.1 Aromatic-ring-hydroxylating dioxygenase alpha subunit [Penicillium verhagenii]